MILNNSKIVYYFLLFIPLVGILNNRIGFVFTYLMIVIFIVLLFLFKIRFKQTNKLIVLYLVVMLLNLFIIYIYQLFEYNVNNIYYIQFFGSQIFFFIIFSFFVNIYNVKEKYLEFFFKYMVILIFFSVIVDFILLKNGFITSQLMYRSGLPSYYSKPFGLFGQFSVNSGYSVIFLLLYKSLKNKNNSKIISFILFIMVTITVFIENSGIGYIFYLLLILSIFYYNKIFRVLLPIFIILVFLLINTNLLPKISIDYIIYNFNYFYNIIDYAYFNNIHNVFDILFGMNGNIKFPIDFGPLFMISKVGLMYFILYSFVLLYMIYKSNNIYIKIVIISLIIGNIHYPVLFYPIMNLVLPLLLILIINQNKFNKSEGNICVE